MSGQHVGRQSDALVEDDVHSAARAQSEALRRLTKPTASRRGGPTTGDGDVCPTVPEHGRMLVLQSSQRQWCPNADHDGVWPTSRQRQSGEGVRQPPTQALYPLFIGGK